MMMPELSADVAACLTASWRLSLTTSSKRACSYFWPPKIFTTRWPLMLVEHIGQVAHGRLRALAQVAHAAPGEGDDDGHHRQQAKAEQGQLPVDDEQRGQVADGGDRIAHRHVDHGEAGLRHLGGVEGHARERGAGGG